MVRSRDVGQVERTTSNQCKDMYPFYIVMGKKRFFSNQVFFSIKNGFLLKKTVFFVFLLHK